MDFDDLPTTDTWEKVTRKIVDPITFACYSNVTYVPRIEDTFYETTCDVYCNPNPRMSVGGFALEHSTCFSRSSASTTPSSPSKTKREDQSTHPPVSTPKSGSVSSPIVPKDNTWTAMDFRTGAPVAKGSRRKALGKEKRSSVDSSTKLSRSKSPKPLRSPPLSPSATTNKSHKTSATAAGSSSKSRKSRSPLRSPKGGKSGGGSSKAKRKSTDSKSSNSSGGTGSTSSSTPPPPPSGGSTTPLGAFLKKDTKVNIMKMARAAIHDLDTDNQSVGSRSIASRSVADISYSEMSEREEKLKSKSHVMERRKSFEKQQNGGGKSMFGQPNSNSTKEKDMISIDESSVTDFSTTKENKNAKVNKSPTKTTTKKNSLGNFFLQHEEEEEVDDFAYVNCAKSVASASTLGTKSIGAEQSKAEKKLKDKSASTHATRSQRRSSQGEGGMLSSFLEGNENISEEGEEAQEEKSIKVEKMIKSAMATKDAKKKKMQQLTFNEGGHDCLEIPFPTDSMYDDLFYTEDELAEFRYEAFLEECGLDAEEFK